MTALAGLFLCVLSQAAPAAIDEADLTRRREALAAWTHEPVALEGQAFLFHLDRRDGSFFIQDRRTQAKWYSPWGRRGFASVRLKGEEAWRPLEKLGGLIAQSNKLRFRAHSADPSCPSVRVTVETHANSRGVAISFEVPEADAPRVEAVRILDGAFWITDADAAAGAAIAAGAGEWHEASAPGALRRRLSAHAPLVPEGREPYTVPLLAMIKQESPLLLTWSSPEAALELERRSVADEKLPGQRLLAATLDLPGSKGQVEVFVLGQEQGGVLDAVRGYKDLLGPAFFERSLRYKTGSRPQTRALLGAALFRIEPGPDRTLGSVAELSRRVKRELGIDEAAFLIAGDGKDPALKACAEAVKAEGHLFGVEVSPDVWIQLSSEAARKEAGTTAAGYFKAALEGAKHEDGCPALAELCSPQIVVVRAPERWGAEKAPRLALEPRRDLLRHVRDTFGLAGAYGGSSSDTDLLALFVGLLPSSTTAAPGAGEEARGDAWPVFAAAFGPCARLTCRSDEPVRPDQPARILAHLLVGEVPLYALPAKGDPPLPASGDASLCFARDEGWAAGKGLSAHEVFLKNTYEVLVHVARQRFRDPLFLHRKLNAAGTARESYFGADLRVVVNFGPGDYEDEEEGFLLPPNGFFVRYPFFRAFHALRMQDVVYERPSCIVMHSLEGKMILRAEEVRLYHAFGPNHFQFGGRTFSIDREAVVKF